ncbi:MAG: hypothetical protein ACI4O0_02405 [Candidatus Limivicinus sp.]
MLPTLFADNGCKVTVCDPAYANYQWIPDLSIFDYDPRIQAYNTTGKSLDAEQKELEIQGNRRNFFAYGLMKSLPLCMQRTIYRGGTYNQLVSTTQIIETPSRATGLTSSFLDCYNVLKNLPGITAVTDDETCVLNRHAAP